MLEPCSVHVPRTWPGPRPPRVPRGGGAGRVALQHSLAEHEGDAEFRTLLGELSVLSSEFATVWAEDLRPAVTSGVVHFPATPIGDLRLRYQVLQVPGDSEDLVFVWGAADEDTRRALTRIAEPPQGRRRGGGGLSG